MLRTTEQKEVLCKTCPVAKAADLLGDSCTLLIVRDLLEGPKRFSELEASLSGISSRTLTKKLCTLEACGMVERAVYAERPPRVEYSLTKKGKGLREVEQALRTFGKKYL